MRTHESKKRTPLRDRSHLLLVFPLQSRPTMLGVDRGQLGLAIPATPTPTPHFHYKYTPISAFQTLGKIPTENPSENYSQFSLSFWLDKSLKKLAILLEF